MMRYDFELGRVGSEVRKAGARRVGLQFPEGLKSYAVELASRIEDETDATVVVFVDPTYGACDTKDEQAVKLGLDLIVHFGHTRM